MKAIGAPARGSTAVLIAIACALVLGVFGRAVTFPFIAFDDAELILRNPQVTDPFASWRDQLSTPVVGYVVPVTVGVEALLFALSGGRAWSFHAVSLLLHMLFAAQLLLLARKLGARPAVALGAALAFALHPLVVQPIAWATCLKDLLMANLALAATVLWLACADDVTPPSAPSRLSAVRAAGAVVLALAAMLAKPSAVLVGLAWLAALGARRIAGVATSRTALPLAAATSALGIALGLASRAAHDAVMGAERASDWTAALPFAVLGRQLRHVVWPEGLRILYAAPVKGFADPDACIGLAATAVLVALFAALRARPYPVLLLSLAVVTYLPTSNLLPFARVMSDSYMYLPLAMLALLAALGGERWLTRTDARLRPLALAALVPVLGLFAGTSYAGLDRWRGGAALWQPVVDAEPGLAQAHRLFGDELVFRGAPERAIEPYRRAFALEYDPRYLVEFGSLLAMAGRVEDAECVLVEAFAFGSDQAQAAYNYAVLLAFHPDYRPREPAAARPILARLDALVAAGRLRWPDALTPGLATQRARLAGAPPEPREWGRRTCAILQAR